MSLVAVLAAALGASIRQTQAGALDDRVPADAIFYAGWSGTETLQASYANSNLKGILDASIAKEFIEKQLPKLIEQAGSRMRGLGLPSPRRRCWPKWRGSIRRRFIFARLI